jgi:hypothetical protein
MQTHAQSSSASAKVGHTLVQTGLQLHQGATVRCICVPVRAHVACSMSTRMTSASLPLAPGGCSAAIGWLCNLLLHHWAGV